MDVLLRAPPAGVCEACVVYVCEGAAWSLLVATAALGLPSLPSCLGPRPLTLVQSPLWLSMLPTYLLAAGPL